MRLARVMLAAMLLASAAVAGVREVELSLPLRPKMAFTGHEKLYIGPFVRENKGDEAGPDLRFDVGAEFERYLRRMLRKEAKFTLVPSVDGLRPPTTDTLKLERDTEFWRELGSRTGADYIIAGAIDFEIQDRSGYKTEEYTSPLDGRTYYRQVFVESTGFTFEVTVLAFDGRTGAKLFQETFKDQKEKSRRAADEMVGLFENLFSLENRLLGLFIVREREANRYVFN